MYIRSFLVLGVAVLACFPGLGYGQDADARKAAVKSLSERIDAAIEANWKEAGIFPAPLTEDGSFFRRVNLDLIGRIPSLAGDFNSVVEYVDDFRGLYAWSWFVKEQDIFDKRYKWVNDLLEHKEKYANTEFSPFARHWANVYRHSMIQNNDNAQAANLTFPFEQFLETRLDAKTGYDKIVREIITASPINQQFFDGRNMPVGSPSAFYFANENKPENLAGATSRVFLGVKLECAQCHAHPFAKWTKDQFWEYAAFFSGINPNQGLRRGGGIQPAINPNQGREIAIPGTNKVAKARFLNGVEPVWKDGMDSRVVLAEWVTAPDNPFFARASVDLVWSYFFGQGLLEPVMEPNDDHPVTHPELLDLLAKEFIAQKYDVKFLIASIVHSKAYRRSSAAHDKMNKHDFFYFARMPVRSLSPEQLFDSIEETTGQDRDKRGDRVIYFNQFNGGTPPPRVEFTTKFASIEKRTEAQTSILQALFLMNGKHLTEKTKVANNQTLKDLVNTKASPEMRIKSLYYQVLSRPPLPRETARLVRYLNGRDPGQGFSDIYWAMLNSAEFMLNH